MILPNFSPALATELVLKLRSVEEIIERYELTKAELKTLLQNPQFQNMVVEAKRQWTSDLSAADRVKLKAAIISEDVLPQIYQMIVNKGIPANSRVDAFKTINRLAQLDTPDKVADSGRFVININLGDDQKDTLVIDSPREKLIKNTPSPGGDEVEATNEDLAYE